MTGPAPAAIVWSETAYNLAYVLLALAVASMAFPQVRYHLMRAVAELGYEARMAQWRAARRAAPRRPVASWTTHLGAAELPGEQAPPDTFRTARPWWW